MWASIDAVSCLFKAFFSFGLRCPLFNACSTAGSHYKYMQNIQLHGTPKIISILGQNMFKTLLRFKVYSGVARLIIKGRQH